MNENDRIITELNPRNIVRMRRKMKKVRRHLPDKEFENWFWSWYNNYKKYLSFE